MMIRQVAQTVPDSRKIKNSKRMIDTQPFGTWDSPLSAQMVTTAGVRLGGVAYISGAAFWAEARPEEDGRVVIVKRVSDQAPVDLIGAPFHARNCVHEYGGGSWWVDARYLYFVHWEDQRLYRVLHETEGAANPRKPEPLTPVPTKAQSLRYADGCVSEDGASIVCVRERHEAGVVHNELVVIANTVDSANSESSIQIIASGCDFYSTPRLSPDSASISWIQWSHPQMPWDGTELVIADVQSDLSIGNIRVIAGGTSTSIMGALWTRDGRVVYASDDSGWWNIYSFSSVASDVEQLTTFTDREVGTPAWIFGTQRFVELTHGDSVLGLAMLVTRQAKDELYVLNPSGETTLVNTPYVAISGIAADGQGRVLLQAEPEDAGASIVLVDCQYSAKTDQSANQFGQLTALKEPEALGVDSDWLSKPEAISFSSGDRQAHAFFYPPAGHQVTGEKHELPPLVVMGHGGPTSHATAGLKLSIQYWTSRGVAVVDVNYGGSSGFGRNYRRLLNGQWGVVDVQDCVAAAEYLAASGYVDAKRMVIRGGSAGGLTVLRALQTSDAFAAGTSLYGVTDLEMLAGDTHKFESRYLDGLLGGSYPEHKSTYVERSPIHHADQLSCPILVLQGDEDKVVPPNQSAAIVDAAAKKGLPHAYVLFAGEQHGFRKTENIIRALQIELWFYGKVLAFVPANNISAPAEAVGF